MGHDIRQTEFGARIEDVEFIWARNSQEFLFANSILVHGDAPVLVDPSANFTYLSRLADARQVKMVLNTHYHGDHRALNHLFKDVVFASHEADARAISDFEHYAAIAVRDPGGFYLTWIKKIFKKYQIVDCPVSVTLRDGDVLDTGAERIRVISIPGHTPGQVALYFENADTLFTADVDLTPHGPWYANVVSDIEAFKHSCEKLRRIECAHYVPSHGDRIYNRAKFLEKLHRYQACFAKRQERILALLKERPMKLDELASHGIIYKLSSLSDPLKAYFQFEMVSKHVEILVRDGQVSWHGALLVYNK